MKSDIEIYKEEKMADPVFKAKYILAKEKLNIELMIDAIDDAYEKNDSHFTMKRRINKLRKHIATLSL
ncbi:MAG: hypothetical protein ABSG15_04710 [FCB group bacterium]|jgi:DNA-dependent RNA polymerase auxiliary subunit epsilon